MSDELDALRAAINQFPQLEDQRLRSVAERKAKEVQAIASHLAPRDASAERGPHTQGQPHLADSIVVTEDAAHRQFTVEPQTPWLPNLGLWVERGTVFQDARPFMRPAGAQVDPSYKAEMLAAAEAVAALFEKL